MNVGLFAGMSIELSIRSRGDKYKTFHATGLGRRQKGRDMKGSKSPSTSHSLGVGVAFAIEGLSNLVRGERVEALPNRL